jgi:hypothetical protein
MMDRFSGGTPEGRERDGLNHETAITTLGPEVVDADQQAIAYAYGSADKRDAEITGERIMPTRFPASSRPRSMVSTSAAGYGSHRDSMVSIGAGKVGVFVSDRTRFKRREPRPRQSSWTINASCWAASVLTSKSQPLGARHLHQPLARDLKAGGRQEALSLDQPDRSRWRPRRGQTCS